VQNQIIRSYRDTYAAAESLRGAHHAMTHAINGTSSAYNSQLHYFNEIMNLSPHYLHFLFDEHGALVDVEDAVYAVTQAQIELLGVRQANAVLDAAKAWQYEEGSLRGYRQAVIDATDGVWGLVDARIELMRQTEIERNLENGWSMSFATRIAERTMQQSGVLQQIDLIRGMTETAQAGARERGVFRPDGAMLVADVTTHDIMGEFVRMR
jgi:hypothetical protein